MDMLQEVFECISKDLMQRTSFGQWFRETNTQVVYEITDMRKAKYLFARTDLDSTEVDPDMILKFKKTKELFELKFHYCITSFQHWTNLTWQFITYNTLINFLLLHIFLLILNWIDVRPRSNLGLHMSHSFKLGLSDFIWIGYPSWRTAKVKFGWMTIEWSLEFDLARKHNYVGST